MRNFTGQELPSVADRTQADERHVWRLLSTSRREKMKKSNTVGAGAMAKDLEFEADVLFQRIYNKWYAFSVVENDCLVTEVPEEEVQKRMLSTKPAKLPRDA
jgi:hypothetical protein